VALKKKARYWYGTSAEDIEAEIVRYSTQNGYQAVQFRQSRCNCGGVVFKLETDEDAGAARRVCVKCGEAHLMADSAEWADEAEFENHNCICDHERFVLVSGVATYESSNDVRWYYIGCLCANCQLVGVFADWKCEAGDAGAFLREV
jgi:ferredoxin-like protein FixX